MNIADLKKNRNMSFGKITEALNKKTEYGDADDSLFWKPERDKAGNGSATIRFLPATEGDELPWIAEYSHSFQGPTGRWYIEKCLSTIGKEDPVNNLNRKLYATKDEKDKEQAKKQKRKLTYISKIEVIADPKKPENDGKVFYFKFGKKIFDKIMDKAQPTFEDEKPLNVFDIFEGVEFKLRIKQVDGFPNYDTSTFSDPKSLDDDEIVRIMTEAAKLKPLKEFHDPSKFKSYEDLEKKLKSVLSDEVGSTQTAQSVAEKMRDAPVASPKVNAPKPVEAPEVETASKEVPSSSDDDDDMTAYFANLAKD